MEMDGNVAEGVALTPGGFPRTSCAQRRAALTSALDFVDKAQDPVVKGSAIKRGCDTDGGHQSQWVYLSWIARQCGLT